MKIRIIECLILFALIVAFVASIAQADEPNDINDVNALAVEVVVMAEQELPKKQKQLDTKIYSGSLTDILTASANDVNTVVVYIDQIETKAERVCKVKGYKTTKINAIKTMIIEKTKQKKLKSKKSNLEAVGGIITALDEIMPDVNDPNYIDQVKASLEIKKALLESLK